MCFQHTYCRTKYLLVQSYFISQCTIFVQHTRAISVFLHSCSFNYYKDDQSKYITQGKRVLVKETGIFGLCLQYRTPCYVCIILQIVHFKCVLVPVSFLGGYSLLWVIPELEASFVKAYFSFQSLCLAFLLSVAGRWSLLISVLFVHSVLIQSMCFKTYLLLN